MAPTKRRRMLGTSRHPGVKQVSLRRSVRATSSLTLMATQATRGAHGDVGTRRVILAPNCGISHVNEARNDESDDLDLANDDGMFQHHNRACSPGIIVRERKRYTISDNPLSIWSTHHRDSYLAAVLALEGRGRLWGPCIACCRPATYRCDDCSGNFPLCGFCLVTNHSNEGLHRFKRWNGERWTNETHRNLGLYVQLGHTPGNECGIPSIKREIVVLALNGIHKVSVRFCGCSGITQYEQCIEYGWWPGSFESPALAATFDLMRFFHILNLQGKVAPMDLCLTLEQLTDGTGVDEVVERLPQLMTMLREWRHIKMAKRCGRGHDVSGISGTKAGEFGILCRACPHPIINLPKDWQSSLLQNSWKYRKIVATDANFHQKARWQVTTRVDPPLGPGWGTFVSPEPYMDYVRSRTDMNEGAHCVAYHSPWKSSAKRSKGSRASGVASVICARHEVYLPNGTGDLQKGERYANMDYIMMSTLNSSAFNGIQQVTISYDKGCHWSLNLDDRLQTMPPALRWPAKLQNASFVVPKFHLVAHSKTCQGNFSFNFTPGVGRTDGEGIERVWSGLNHIAASASQMTVGGRYNTLDDFCNYHNYRKMVALGEKLLRDMAIAIREAIIQYRAFVAFASGLHLAGNKEELRQWISWVEKWEADNSSCTSPYVVTDKVVSLADIKRTLAEEEHRKVERGEAVLSDISPSEFIITGLNLEDARRILEQDIKEASKTATQSTNIQRSRTTHLRRLQIFRKAQATYMPAVVDHVRSLPASQQDTNRPEQIPICLPSTFEKDVRQRLCGKELSSIEARLRIGMMEDALRGLRNQLKIRSLAHMYRPKKASHRMQLRTFTLFRQVQRRIRTYQERYNKARDAYFKLIGPGHWEDKYLPLKPEDIVGVHERVLTQLEQEAERAARHAAGWSSDDEHELKLWDLDGICIEPTTNGLQLGEGTRVLSWIWRSSGTEEVGEELRVEFLKARSRAARWYEELILLEEEMRRALQFCEWKANWWTEHANPEGMSSTPWVLEGIRSYSIEQAVTEQRRQEVWKKKWETVRKRSQDVLKTNQVGKVEDILATVEKLQDLEETSDETPEELLIEVQCDAGIEENDQCTADID